MDIQREIKRVEVQNRRLENLAKHYRNSKWHVERASMGGPINWFHHAVEKQQLIRRQLIKCLTKLNKL